jgi:hypothetical protein
MQQFKKSYIKLLRSQVEDEIAYLRQGGHSKEFIREPCIFCYRLHSQGTYLCHRITELERYLGFIADKELKELEQPLAGKNSLKPTFLAGNSPPSIPNRREIGQIISEFPQKVQSQTNFLENGLLPPSPSNLKF